MTALSSQFGTQGTGQVATAAETGGIAILIPTLNEARHILGVIKALAGSADRLGAQIVVIDGGSTDGTVDLVRAEAARRPGLTLLHNPKRLQSAAINLAIERFGDRLDWIIRVDAHADYPEDYCDVLLAEAQRTGADSVVVRMHATGTGPLQTQIAAAQNSLFGNGGSAHRGAGEGRFVDHGHHALMRVAAFRAVGGYDESFSHNEDAELDQRLGKQGFRIWLTAATRMIYFPRNTLRGLAKQYYRFGRGRMATARKHPGSLHKRHAILISLAPLLLLAALSPLYPLLALPFSLWLAACLAAGLATALRARSPGIALCGVPGAVMQMSWSLGFWSGLLLGRRASGTGSGPGSRQGAMTGHGG
ncbi:succinoglycan biosynthesis protein exoa [Tabrizicola sp. TH137]|uniref:glycosyltransferase family 2 protein n=1 Tax=Tabrizicola sp. TH137 TaxID=2067452 RepID=UPI000C7E0359|nr:glycosyltransferase family 2 protein [Tabrizicola sp. TH137]PLL10662.1 succinoglycan biosynthesis protein exoa [Tabrizicola sp. TH137]